MSFFNKVFKTKKSRSNDSQSYKTDVLANLDKTKNGNTISIEANNTPRDIKMDVCVTKKENEITQDSVPLSDIDKLKESLEFLLKQSKTLLKEHRFDEAFRNLQKATYATVKLDQIGYIDYSQRISLTQAEICYKQKPQNYTSALYYYLCSRMINLFLYVTFFPDLNSFLEIKNNYAKSPPTDYHWYILEDSINALNMKKCKRKLLNELYRWGCHEFPNMYGIPKEYDYEKIINDKIVGNKTFGFYYNISEKLKQKSLCKDVADICSYVSKTVKKYYNECNQIEPNI